MGCLSPLGQSVAETWAGCLAARSGIVGITHFDASEMVCRVAGELRGEIAHGLPPKEARRTDRVILMALAAAREALDDAALVPSVYGGERIGVAIGSGIGGLGSLLSGYRTLLEKGPRRVSPFTIPMGIANMPSGVVSIQHGLGGPNVCHASACSSAAHAIGEGALMIQRGMADAMLVGGSEAPIVDLSLAGFGSMKALSLQNDSPTRASRPFDRARDGFVMGEGAGVLVLERMDRARERGAKIRAELVGYGSTADASHMAAPDPSGHGAARCMTQAIEDAGVPPSEVGYVNAHATSTPAGDPAEVSALRQVFGDALDDIPVSATKSMTGHLLGAAGALESILTLLALETGSLPPTINLDDPDPECQLDHVANKVRAARVYYGLSNSFGFGGTNCSLIFSTADLP
jgi:3-oxoacyl-[acyl-carrier-protein] synthase II